MIAAGRSKPGRAGSATTLAVILAAIPAVLVGSWPAAAQHRMRDFMRDVMRDWQIDGSLTGAIENYSDAGDPAQSPFAERTTFGFAEMDLNLSRRYSPFENVSGQFFGALTDNPFRSNFDGFVAERARFGWEKGNVAVPFRLEAGDIFGLTTARTLQRSLKGAQIELQPQWSFLPGFDHSLNAFWGINQATYRDLDFDNDQTFGLSWLVHGGSAGTYSVNLVNNRIGAGVNGVAAERFQTVASLAGERRLGWAGQDLTLKGELGLLAGDDIGGTRPDETGMALFTEIRGREGSRPLDYSLRFEQFDSDYRPNGASVAAGRRSLATNGGWRFDSGLALRGRGRWDRSDFGRANPTDTFSAGLNLAGPFQNLLQGLAPSGLNLTGSLDGAVTRTQDRANTVGTTTHVLAANLSAPLWQGDGSGVNGRLGYQFQSVRALNATPAVSSQVSLGADYRFGLSGIAATVSPTLSWRRNNGGNAEGEDYSASLGLSAARDAWSVQANYRLSKLFRDTAGADTTTNSFRGSLNWQQGPHRLSVEADFSVQERQAAQANQPLKLAARYTLSFGKVPGHGLFEAAPPPAGFAPALVAAGGDTLDLTALAPNSLLTDVLETLTDQGLRGGQAAAEGLIVYEGTAYPEITLRQRVAVRHRGARFRQAALVIDPANPSDAVALQADFDLVLTEMIRIYGAPDSTFERGDFTGDPVVAIDDGDLIRLAEWRTASGTLRLGLPRRLDGQVRIELHHARSFPPPSFTLWGMDEVN